MGWHARGGSAIDTGVEPGWLRTGYKYFPYAALLDGLWWTLRTNFCFPTHELFTLFVDGSAVADVTASADDDRRLVTSIGQLSATHPLGRHGDMPVMSAASAKAVVEVVAPFIDHGSEWGDSCDLCEFSDRDPFRVADR